MKCDIVLSGVGGQGILTIAAIIGQVAVEQGLYVKHGMSQRGGSVHAHLRLSSEPIFADLIPQGKADVIIAMEPMEALRYADFLKPDGVIISNASSIVNIDDYPENERLQAAIRAYAHGIVIDGDALAKEAGSPRAVNMVLLGAVANFLDMDSNLLRDAIAKMFARKGDAIVQMNLVAFDAGAKAAK